MRLRFAAVASVGCMELKVARRKGKGTGVSGMAAVRGVIEASRFIRAMARVVRSSKD